MVIRNRSLSMTLSSSVSKNESKKSKESIFELKEVQNLLKYEWPQCLQDNANPIEMAISLLDDTSVGLAHKLPDFEDIYRQTQRSLRHVVNEHYELFNNSIGSYHLLLSTLKDSQGNSAKIKELLEATTKDVSDRSDTLNELNQTSVRYSEMIEILNAMDELTSIPDKIDQLILDKRIHEVYDVIANGYKTAEKYNLWSLAAMNSIHSYLEMQSNNLFDMIVDELQNEIYLKNAVLRNNYSIDNQFFSWQTLIQSNNPQLSAFKTLITESHNLEQYIYNSANLDISEIADCFNEPVEHFIKNQLPKVHTYYANNDGEIDYSILLDSTSNVSSESFHYIYMLLHTASKLNRLHQVVEILINNNQSELHGLINRTTEEVKLKYAEQLNKLTKLQNFDSSNLFDVFGHNIFNDASVVILQDLFGGIFLKTLAVLQKHKVVGEVVERIESAQNLAGTPKFYNSFTTGSSGTTNSNGSYDFNTIWNVLKNELSALMNNYIYDDLRIHSNINENIPNLKDNKSLHDVLKKKDLFKFEDVLYSNKSTKTPEDLQTILQGMFPGFVLSNYNKNDSLINTASPYIKNETFNAMVEVLVPKNIFNMRIILEFFLIFIAGSQKLFLNFDDESQISGPYNRTSLQFFDSFMKFSFLSNLRKSLDISFREYVGGKYVQTSHDENGSTNLIGFKSDLVSLDNGTETTSKSFIEPINSKSAIIYQNALNFKRLFINVCSVLNTSLAYRADFSDLALNFLQNFSNAYTNFYKELLSTSETNNTIPSLNTTYSNKPRSQISTWMTNTKLSELSVAILQKNSNAGRKDLEELIEIENHIILLKNENPTEVFNISKDDLLDNDSFNQVCYLLLTTLWILTWLPLMKKESNYTIYNDDTDIVKSSTVDKLKHDWCFLENGRTKVTISATNTDINKQHIYLALNADKISQFNEIIKNFEMIRDKTLLALRYDLRCKSIYFIGKSFKQNDWLPPTEPGDSDQFIGQLSKEIFSIDNKLNNMLKEITRDGVFIGLPEFINKLMIQGSELIRKINNNGIKKIMLNVFTLQQMLRNLMKNPEIVDFTRSSAYFNLFTLNEYTFLNTIKVDQLKYSLDELNSMARLMYSEKLADGNGSAFNKSKYNDLLKKIHDCLK